MKMTICALHFRHKKNLQAEAEKLSRLNHQNIVQLYGVVLEAGNYSVVLEYVEHGNLDDFINTYKVVFRST